MRTSAAASMRSTSTLVIVFHNARVGVRQGQMLRLAFERDDGQLVGAGLHDLEMLRGHGRMRLGEQQRLVGIERQPGHVLVWRPT
jgi:hypothetical protein